MSDIRAVILDVDGTLIYSNDAHARAFVEAAEEMGLAADFAQIRRMIGMGGDKLIPKAFGFTKESEQGQELDRRKGEIFRKHHLPGLESTPGTRELLERLRQQGKRLVVATSAQKRDLQGLLERAGISDLIDDSTSASEVEESKPDPDVVNAALRQTGEPSEAVLMIGDTPYDVEAAGRAGVRILSVRCGGWDDTELRGSLAVFQHPADLLDHYEETPLA